MLSHRKNTRRILIWTIGLVFFVVSCAGESPSRKDKDSSSDISTADLPPPSEGVVSPDTGTCSPAGISTACDPSVGSGCGGEGWCYLLSLIGTACVCPAGTAATGDTCNTTIECAPGNVCAGTSPPGTCRVICDPNASQCDAQEKCTPISAHPQYGYCEPN